jgi:hypothetical protein
MYDMDGQFHYSLSLLPELTYAVSLAHFSLVLVVVSSARHLQGSLLVGRYGTSRGDDVTAGKELLVCQVGVCPFSQRSLLRQI